MWEGYFFYCVPFCAGAFYFFQSLDEKRLKIWTIILRVCGPFILISHPSGSSDGTRLTNLQDLPKMEALNGKLKTELQLLQLTQSKTQGIVDKGNVDKILWHKESLAKIIVCVEELKRLSWRRMRVWKMCKNGERNSKLVSMKRMNK